MSTQHSAEGAALTDLILETFRFNGELLAAGDALGADLGLTSARWQILGAIAEGPLTVPAIGRRAGLTRQAVQRVVNDLVSAGLVRLVDNPDHKRAKLIDYAPRGRRAHETISRHQITWANRLAAGLAARRLADAAALLRLLRQRLEEA
ncbi:MAG: MarR family transcriptional regulator [Alphaproteobacteria bacterium]|nr:MarR family transcriptional regulator [Alphaproteobacteria bacterium]